MEFYIRAVGTEEEISTEVQEVNLEVESNIDDYDFTFMGETEASITILLNKADLLTYFKHRNDYIIRELFGGE